MTTQGAPPSTIASPSPGILRRWPSLFAVVAVVLITIDGTEGADEAEALAAALLVYLATAMLGRPSAAWALFAGALVVIFATEVASGGDVDSTWILLGLSVPLLLYGLRSGATRSSEVFQHQAIAMLGLGAVTVAALLADDDVGAYLLAAGLIGHALWDGYLHRANREIIRSMTEFCFVLDTVLAVIIVITTI